MTLRLRFEAELVLDLPDDATDDQVRAIRDGVTAVWDHYPVDVPHEEIRPHLAITSRLSYPNGRPEVA